MINAKIRVKLCDVISLKKINCKSRDNDVDQIRNETANGWHENKYTAWRDGLCMYNQGSAIYKRMRP